MRTSTSRAMSRFTDVVMPARWAMYSRIGCVITSRLIRNTSSEWANRLRTMHFWSRLRWR